MDDEIYFLQTETVIRGYCEGLCCLDDYVYDNPIRPRVLTRSKAKINGRYLFCSNSWYLVREYHSYLFSFVDTDCFGYAWTEFIFGWYQAYSDDIDSHIFPL